MNHLTESCSSSLEASPRLDLASASIKEAVPLSMSIEGAPPRPAAAGSAPARPAPSAGGGGRFNLGKSNLTRFRVVSHRCGSRACESCGPVRGYDTREVLLGKAHLFKAPLLLTLTVDRNGTTTGQPWDSPEAVHEFVTRKSLIPRLMRFLGIVVWFWVLEFQSKTGDGWPHWHLLVDVAAFGGRLPVESLRRAWRLWRDKWHVGGLDVERVSFSSAEHSIRYITKYLCKQPETGYPPWVLKATKSIRLLGGSKVVGALTPEVSGGKGPDESWADDDDDEDGSAAVPLLERLVGCRCCSVLVREDVDTLTGEVRCSYEAAVDVARDRILSLVADGDVEGRVELVCGDRGRTWRQCFLTADGFAALLAWEPEPPEQEFLAARGDIRRSWISSRWWASQAARQQAAESGGVLVSTASAVERGGHPGASSDGETA